MRKGITAGTIRVKMITIKPLLGITPLEIETQNQKVANF